MKIPRWAPSDLVIWYNSFENKDNCDAQMLMRLITRPEMEEVWEWVSNQQKQQEALPLSANGGMVGYFFLNLEDYIRTARLPKSERQKDIQEIKNLSSKLSKILKKYKDELIIINNYSIVIPVERDDYLLQLLNPKYQERLKAEPFGLRDFWDYLLPPLHEVLENLSGCADSVDMELGKRYPLKIRQKTSLHTYLIRCLYSNHFLGLWDKFPYHIASNFLCVALDDDSITSDIVRKTVEHFNKNTG